MVEEGFQNTDAGIIPIDWKEKKLFKVATFDNGKAHEQFIDDKGAYVVVNSKFISTEGAVRKYSNKNLCPLKKGDIAIVMSDIPNGRALAKCFLVDKDDYYTLNQRIGCIRAGDELHTEFLYYFLNRNKYFLSFDNGAGQTNLRRSEVIDCPIAFPKEKAEQQNVATVLDDIDAYVSELELLITKKQRIREGTLYMLLSQTKRLNDYKGNWNEKSLEQTSSLKARIGWQGLTTAEYLNDGEYFLVTGTDFMDGHIQWETCHYVDRFRYQQDRNIQLKINDILVTKDGTIGKVAFIDKLPKPATLNSGVFVIRPINDDYEPLFLYYVLRSSYFKTFLNQLAAGSTIVHLFQKDFVHFRFPLPPIKEEQNDIATILWDIDNEIFELNKKLTKYISFQQALRQSLLTGKKRLI